MFCYDILFQKFQEQNSLKLSEDTSNRWETLLWNTIFYMCLVAPQNQYSKSTLFVVWIKISNSLQININSVLSLRHKTSKWYYNAEDKVRCKGWKKEPLHQKKRKTVSISRRHEMGVSCFLESCTDGVYSEVLCVFNFCIIAMLAQKV